MPAMESLILAIAGFFVLGIVLWIAAGAMFAGYAALEGLLGVLISKLDRPISLHRASESTRKLVFWRSKRLSQ